MDPQQIKTLMDAMTSSGLSELEFSQDGWTLRLSRHGTVGATAASAPRTSHASHVAPSPVTQGRPATSSGLANPSAATALDAPLYGIVHLSPSPSEPPFVRVGDTVRVGQALCVIEAMKVFNEVCAERDAVLQDILVASGQEVESGQTLFRFA